MISAYHPGFPSFFKQVEGLCAGLAKAGYHDLNVVLDVEFMDTKRFSPKVRFKEVADEVGAKLRRLRPYDVVVAADDNAFRFVAANRETLFGRAPVVFLGVGNLRMAEAEHRTSGAVGVIESPSQRETLTLANRLFPKAPRLHAVVDGTTTGRMIHRQLKADIDSLPFGEKVNVISLETLTHFEFFRLMAGIPATEPILLRSAFRDSTGATREFQDILQNLRAVYRGAIFSVQEHGLGTGILGGRVISHLEQGRAGGGSRRGILTVLRRSP